MALDVIDKRTPGDLWHGRSEPDAFLSREDRNWQAKKVDCPRMVEGWRQLVAWCREEVRLTYELKEAGLESFQIGACLPQAKRVFNEAAEG